ncbi:hypothetical protein V5O48_012562 [Marasmius crinis-equi]|uniref:Uncharacterized protein n=1 Tax=Marasmius crinis-equi TaxID=585013 RepID=A0ABR3F2I7_9AGAR
MRPSSAHYEPLDIDENDVGHRQRPHARIRSQKLQRIFILAFIFLFAVSVFGIWRKPDVGTPGGGSIDTHLDENLKIGNVSWVDCEPLLQGVDCGYIIAPKDHSNHELGKTSIFIARYKARRVPRKGVVFMNPGGPGHPGTSLALEKGGEMAEVIGDDWDLIGFDPRGVGRTVPSTRCFGSTEDFRKFFANTVVERGLTVPSISDLDSSSLRQSLVEQYKEFNDLKKRQGEICKEKMGDDLRHMGSATVARDIDFMSRVLEGDEAKINYWGESYGTFIASNLINIFPERIGKIVMDGVVNPVLLTQKPTYKWPINWTSDSEKTYETFLKDCSRAGPTRCPLAESQDEPRQQIEARIEKFLDTVAQHRIPLGLEDGHGLLTSGTVRALLFIALHSPKNWPTFAQTLANAMAANHTAQAALYRMAFPALHDPPHPPFARDLERQAITCLDAPVASSPVSAEELADQSLKALREASRHFGASTGLSEPDGGCEFWPMNSEVQRTEIKLDKANEAMKSGKRVLIISNTADPVTPMSSGLLVNSLMPDSSTFVIQDGPGHCSTSFPSQCIKDLQKAFWAGRVPENGTVCTIDRHTFSD